MEIDGSYMMSSLSDLTTSTESTVSAEDAAAFEAKLQNASDTQSPEELREVCEEFESMMINMMLTSMRSTVVDGGLTEKSQGTEMFEDMYYDELSQSMSSGGGIGIADMMYDNLSKKYGIGTEEAPVSKLDIKG